MNIHLWWAKCPHCQKEIQIHVLQESKKCIGWLAVSKMEHITIRASKNAKGWINITEEGKKFKKRSKSKK